MTRIPRPKTHCLLVLVYTVCVYVFHIYILHPPQSYPKQYINPPNIETDNLLFTRTVSPYVGGAKLIISPRLPCPLASTSNSNTPHAGR